MLRRLPLLAFVAALASATPAYAFQAPAGAAAWPQQGSDLPADPDVRFGVLPNGMRYALRRNATPPGQAALRLRIGAGSLEEEDDQRGLAHFMEHMVFNGSTHVPEGEFVRRLERHGMRFGPDTNASTEFGQTVYKLDLPQTDADTVDTALFLLREAADQATLAQDAIDRERGIVQSEERTRSNPQLRVLIDELGFTLRGLRLPTRMPIGVPEVIANAQRDRFAAFYNAYYRPERATLIAVGDFDLDEMEAKIRAQFASWQGEGPAGRDPDLGTVAANRPTEARIFVEPGAPTRVSLSWVRAPDLSPDTQARRIGDLAEGLALQVLNRRLERIAASQSPSPFVVAMGVSTTLARSAELTQLNIVTQPDQWRTALGVVETEQRRLAEQGVGADELNREIERVRAALTAAAAGAATMQTPLLAEAMTGAVDRDKVITSAAEDLTLFNAAVAQLTPERVSAAARAVFAGDPLLYMSSPTAVEGGEAALLAAYRESRAAPLAAAQVQQAQTWPYADFGTAGQVTARRELTALGATAVTFANGVRLTVKPTTFADDQILVAVRAGNGRLGFAADRPSPEWAMSLAVTLGGLGRISAEDMQEALAGHTYSAGVAVMDDAFLLSGATRPQDFALQMQVLAAYVSDPGWRPSGWDRLKALSGTIQDQLASTPEGVFNRDSGQLLHGGDRRWATPTREEMAASSIADARAVLAPAFAGPIEVVVVGDVTVDEVIARTAATFGALPARAAAPTAAPEARFPAHVAEPVHLTHRGRADQGLAYIGWPTTGFYGDTARSRTLNLLGDVMQLRLLQRIREEQGTTYSPKAAHDASEAMADYGLFSAQIEARPEALAGFLTDAAAIARDLRDRPIDDDELQRALRPRLEAVQRQRAGNPWWLVNLFRAAEEPAVAASVADMVEQYRAITPADLQRAARDYLRPDRAWSLIVTPEAGTPAS